jgi:hypothetical protein
VWCDAGLVEELWGEFAREGFDLACERAFLGLQLLHASSDRAQRAQTAAQLGVLARIGSRGREAAQQRGLGQRPQLAAQRLGAGDQQVARLGESGALRVDRAFPSGYQRLQRLPLTTRPRRRRPLLAEHATSGADSVERVGLATRATLPPQPAHLEHPLARAAPETGQTGTERASPLDSKDSPTRGVRVDDP